MTDTKASSRPVQGETLNPHMTHLAAAEAEIGRLRAKNAQLLNAAMEGVKEIAQLLAENARLRAVLKDCLTAIEERWGTVGSPPHLLGQIRAALEDPEHEEWFGDETNRESTP